MRLIMLQGYLDISSQAQYDYFVETNKILYTTFLLFRMIGRISFPIFCFLIVQGFIHTRDVKKYLSRILLFAFISGVPFDITFFQNTFYADYQNILFTLFFGVLALQYTIIANKTDWSFAFRIIFVIIANGSCLAAPYFFKSDYGLEGVLSIIIIYLFKSRNTLSAALGCVPLLSLSSFLSLVPIHFYNGEKGKNMIWIFYIFYPVHILLIYLLSCFSV